VTLPNSTIIQLTLNNTNISLNWYNLSFTIPSLTGQYNITFIANDTSNNINSTETTFFVGNNQPPSIVSVILNSTLGTNFTTENLTAYPINVSDPENDAVKNIYDWKMNQSSIAVVNMPFEGGSNSTFTKDYSDSGNNGNVSGATWNSTGGYDGKGAYEFDGVDDSVNLGNDSSLDLPGSASISLWGYKNSNNNFQMWLAKGNTGYQILDTGTTGVIQARWGVDIIHVSSTSALSTGAWHHIVVTYNSSLLSLYVNGQLNASAAHTINAETISDNLFVGRRHDGFSFNGSIDEVLIFNRSLSAEQVSALYKNRTDLIVSQETSIGDNWSVGVTPNDGTQDGTTVQSNIHTIAADTIPPNVTITSPANNSKTSDPTPAISFNLTDNAYTTLTYQIYIDGNVTTHSGTGSTTAGVETTVSITSALALGDHNVTVIGIVSAAMVWIFDCTVVPSCVPSLGVTPTLQLSPIEVS